MRIAIFLLMLSSGLLYGQQPAPGISWLDQPLANWNKPGAAVPRAGLASAARERLMSRCQLAVLKSTPAERALTDAGWIAFLNFDQKLVKGDIEVVDGMTEADGMCRPVNYNVFVFVGGRFAGTMSPTPMTSRVDSSSGAVRILDGDTLSVEFTRYTSKDPLCCPSSRVTVQYQIDRTGSQPVVMPTDLRIIRSM